MGADLNAWIEYDAYEDPPFGRADACECLPLDQWIDLRSNKDYLFMGAISGCRNSTGTAPLISPRGCPPNPSYQVRTYFGQDYPDNSGWLNASEVFAALNHHKIRKDQLSLEVKVVLSAVECLAKELSPSRVRLVFEIESA